MPCVLSFANIFEDLQIEVKTINWKFVWWGHLPPALQIEEAQWRIGRHLHLRIFPPGDPCQVILVTVQPDGYLHSSIRNQWAHPGTTDIAGTHR